MAAADVQVQAFKAEIRRTFSLVEPIASAAAAIFYPTLWEIDPSTKVRGPPAVALLSFSRACQYRASRVRSSFWWAGARVCMCLLCDLCKTKDGSSFR